MSSIFFQTIEKYDIITIFRHAFPDSDALGAQFGLKEWINNTYPNKQVYALGFDDAGSKSHMYPKMDQCDDETVSNSLAIILDSANATRIDDQRYKNAKFKMKVDHHIFVEKYADVELIQDIYGATCEILADFFDQANIKLSKSAAHYFYCGLIADTLRFSIPTITSKTLHLAAYLIDCGADVAKANEDQFSTTLNSYRFENYIRANCEFIDDVLAYKILTKEEYESFGMNFQEAKEKVFVMSGVRELKAWCLFTENKEENGIKYFNGSLRSKQILINDLATKYRGGGHRYACGVKNLTLEEIDELLDALRKRL